MVLAATLFRTSMFVRSFICSGIVDYFQPVQWWSQPSEKWWLVTSIWCFVVLRQRSHWEAAIKVGSSGPSSVNSISPKDSEYPRFLECSEDAAYKIPHPQQDKLLQPTSKNEGVLHSRPPRHQRYHQCRSCPASGRNHGPPLPATLIHQIGQT